MINGGMSGGNTIDENSLLETLGGDWKRPG